MFLIIRCVFSFWCLNLLSCLEQKNSIWDRPNKFMCACCINPAYFQCILLLWIRIHDACKEEDEGGCSVECLTVGLTAVAVGLDLTLSELGVPKWKWHFVHHSSSRCSLIFSTKHGHRQTPSHDNTNIYACTYSIFAHHTLLAAQRAALCSS